jgi:hypothetical protein
MKATHITVGLVFSVTLSMVGGAIAAKPPASSGSGWSAATAISPVGQPDPTRGSQLNDVAVNANGFAIAAWDQFTYTTGGPYTIGAAVQSGGKWGAPFTISGTSGFSMSPRVAVGADGSMAVSWTWQDAVLPLKRVQVAVKSSTAGGWSTTTLAEGSVGGVAMAEFVPVAVDATGNVTAVWSFWDGTRHLVQAATKPKDQAWSAVVTLSAPSADGISPCLALNAHGDAAVAFSLSPYSSYLIGTNAQYVARSGPTGAWTQPVVVSETMPSSVGYVTNPHVALDAGGLGTVIYMASGLEGTRQLSSGAWMMPTVVIQPPNAVSSYTSVDLGLDQYGNAVVAASIFDATIGVDRASVHVATGTADGAWSVPQRITDPTASVDAYATRVAVSSDGLLAIVGWIDHYHGTVQVARLNGGAWGAAATIGRGTAFSSFQEVLGLSTGSSTVARAIWKNAKTGTQIMAASYGR